MAKGGSRWMPFTPYNIANWWTQGANRWEQNCKSCKKCEKVFKKLQKVVKSAKKWEPRNKPRFETYQP